MFVFMNWGFFGRIPRVYVFNGAKEITKDQVIVVLNMETIIPKCETIGNPKINTESNTTANNPVSNGISQHTTLPPTNRFGATNMSNNSQSFRPTVQPAYQPPPMYKSHGEKCDLQLNRTNCWESVRNIKAV